MNWKKTIALALTFIVLGAYVYFVEIKQHESKKQLEEKSKKVFNFVTDSVKTIALKNSFGQFVIKKIQGEWRITEPIYTQADKSTITTMLNSLKNSKKETTFSVAPGELAQYGLGQGAIKVRLSLEDGSTDSLELGEKTPVGAYVYTAKTDSQVFTINSSVKSTLDKKLFDIRDKKYLHFKRDQVQNITLRNRYGKYEFEKTGDKDWTFVNIQRPANKANLNSILSKLEYSNAKAFVDETGTKLRQYGLSKPAYQVDLLVGTDKGRKRLIISRKIKGKYYAKDDSRKPIFQIDSLLVKDINKKMKDFRDTDFAEFKQGEVNRIEIEYPDTLIRLQKDTTNNWLLADSAGRKAEISKINSFFSNFNYSKIEEFVKDGKYNPAKYGFDKPSLKLSLYRDDQLLLQATFGKKKGKNYYATTSAYQSVYLVSETKFKQLKLKLDKILEPKPQPEKSGEQKAA